MPNFKQNVISVLCKRHAQYFFSKLKDAENIQQNLLKTYLEDAKDTVYGREKHLSEIKSIDQLRKNIPLQNYEDYSGYVERIKNGEKNVLFPVREKIIMFAMSSGTTGKPKYIPVTGSFFNSYQRGSLYWSIFMFLSYPGVLDGTVLPIVSSMSERKTPMGIDCGGISGLVIRSQRPLAKTHYKIPYAAYDVKNTDDKYYAILRFALAQRNIRIISSANPSTLLRLGKNMDTWKEALISDIFDGTLRIADNLPKELKNSLKPRIKKNKERANELELIAKRQKKLSPAVAWPSLYLVSCWRGGTVGQYLPLLEDYYGKVPVYELGLLASEGRMSIPTESGNNQGVLDIFSNFYEFIPEEEEDNTSCNTLLMNELSKGKRYFMVISTPYGFFRYCIHDLIEVTGFCEGVPVISFLNKGKHISSLTGEKLTEFQICEAVKREGRIKGEEYTFFPCWDNRMPHYNLVVEEAALNDIEPQDLLVKLDGELKNLNIEYREKRNSGRLGPLRLLQAPSGTFLMLKSDIIKKQGGRSEQYKQIHLDVQKKICSYIRI